MNTKETTNLLKSFAILAVCGNHFIIEFISREYGGYANGFIAIFFVLSGYGIFLSLEKSKNISFSCLTAIFFQKRMLRIYPLFWFWCILHGFSNGFLGFFALDFIHPKSPWFIPAIVQCYILSIPLYYFSKCLKIATQFVFIIIVLLFTNYFLFNEGYSPIRAIGYRDMFFLHIFQFYLGFILAQIKIRPKIFQQNYSHIFFICIFLFFVHETTSHNFIEFQGRNVFFPILFSISTVLLCFSFFQSNLKFNTRIFSFIGTYTYSIYLFHGVSFNILSKLDIIQKHNTELTGILIWILTFPLFILFFAVIETTINEIIFGKCSPRNAVKVYLNSMKIQIGK